MDTNELDAHEAIDLSIDERLDGSVVDVSDRVFTKQRVDLPGGNRHEQFFTCIPVNRFLEVEHEADLPQLVDGEVAVSCAAGIVVVDRDDLRCWERNRGRTSLPGVGRSKCTANDLDVHGTPEGEDGVDVVGGGRISEHAQAILTIDEVRPIVILGAVAPAIVRGGNQRGIAVAVFHLHSGGGANPIEEIKLRVLGFLADVWPQAGTLLLELDLDVRMIRIDQSSVDLV